MLTVETYVAQAGRKGLGLFAAEPIAAGQVWWQFDPCWDRIVTAEEVADLPPLARAFLTVYGSTKPDGSVYLCTDDARFVNHSDDPNTRPAARTNSLDWEASRDIAAGEEITSDYRLCCETCRPALPFANLEREGLPSVHDAPCAVCGKTMRDHSAEDLDECAERA